MDKFSFRSSEYRAVAYSYAVDTATAVPGDAKAEVVKWRGEDAVTFRVYQFTQSYRWEVYAKGKVDVAAGTSWQDTVQQVQADCVAVLKQLTGQADPADGDTLEDLGDGDAPTE